MILRVVGFELLGKLAVVATTGRFPLAWIALGRDGDGNLEITWEGK